MIINIEFSMENLKLTYLSFSLYFTQTQSLNCDKHENLTIIIKQ
jgi:hypothetical protein